MNNEANYSITTTYPNIPLFGRGITIDSVQFASHSPDLRIMLQILCKTSIMGSLPAFQSSALILLVPGDLLCFSLLIVNSTCSRNMGGSSSG